MSQTDDAHRVTIFSPYEFYTGQKIHIESGPRRGDWEVVSMTEKKVKLKCPVSFREFEWNRFCYQTKEQVFNTWPQED